MVSNYIAGWGSIGADVIPPKEYYEKMVFISPFLRRAGIEGMPLTYAIAQVMHESNNQTSNLARNYHNFSGIKYAGQKNAKAGPAAPDGGNYAAYNSTQDWANDYARILRIDRGKGMPITAGSAQEFYDRLLANKYFTDPFYSQKFNQSLRYLNAALQWATQQAIPASQITYQGTQGNPTRPVPMVTPGTQTVIHANDPKGRVDKDGNPIPLEMFPDFNFKAEWSKLSMVVKVALVIGGVIVVKKLLD